MRPLVISRPRPDAPDRAREGERRGFGRVSDPRTITIKPLGSPIRIVLPDGSAFLLTAYGHPDRPDRHGLHVSATVAAGGDISTECTILPLTGNAVVLRATR